MKNTISFKIIKSYTTKTAKNAALLLFLVLILGLSIRGLPGNPNEKELLDAKWIDAGPFELSPERGRFALLYSLVENKSLQFSVPVARFATPDVGYTNGEFVSLFAPGVSFITIPGYIIGKMYNASQLGSYTVIALFAVFNVFLIKEIAVKLGASKTAGTIAGLLFLFASPAFAYSVTLYQHHISTFLILASFYTMIRWNTFLSLIFLWFFAAISVAVDYPNVFMMLPLGIVGLGRLFETVKYNAHLRVRLLLFRLFSFIAVVGPLAFFLWFNYASYGNPLQLSGGIKRVKTIDETGNPVESREKLNAGEVISEKKLEEKQSVTEFFYTRNMLNGFYEHFLSFDRGIVVFTPVMLMGFLGMVIAIYRKTQFFSLLVVILGINILLYSMWGDPYGGWAFGSRYLIPSYAILSIFVAILLTAWRKHLFFLLLFFVMASYSVSVNTLGSVTSNKNPPKVETQALEQVSGIKQYYTYQRNIEYLNENFLKSFVYQSYAKQYITAWQYYTAIVTTVILVLFGLLANAYRIRESAYYEK